MHAAGGPEGRISMIAWQAFRARDAASGAFPAFVEGATSGGRRVVSTVVSEALI
jgi:hypothetical protein